MLVDLHVQLEDTTTSLDEAVKHAEAAGLDGILLVQDDAFPDVQRHRKAKGVKVFSGARLSSDRGDYLVILPFPETLPPFTEVFGEREEGAPWSARDILSRTRALGGAAVVAHPYDPNAPHPAGDVVFTLRGISAVEVVNPSRSEHIAAPAAEAAEYLEIPGVGASEAKTPAEIGRAATLFAQRFDNEQGLIEALHRRECWPVEFTTPPFGE